MIFFCPIQCSFGLVEVTEQQQLQQQQQQQQQQRAELYVQRTLDNRQSSPSGLSNLPTLFKEGFGGKFFFVLLFTHCSSPPSVVFTISMSNMAKREAVLKLIKEGKKNYEIVQELKNIGVKKTFIWDTRSRFQETGSITDRPRSGHPNAVRTPARIKAIWDKICQNKRPSIRKMAKEVRIKKDAMHDIIRKDLALSSFCLELKKQTLTDATRHERLTRGKELLRRVQSGTLPRVLFTDKKLFSVEEA